MAARVLSSCRQPRHVGHQVVLILWRSTHVHPHAAAAAVIFAAAATDCLSDDHCGAALQQPRAGSSRGGKRSEGQLGGCLR